VLICCERKVLAAWWLVPNADLVREKHCWLVGCDNLISQPNRVNVKSK